MPNNERKEGLTQTAIKLIKEQRPKNTEKLVALLKAKFQLTEQEIINHIIQMQNEEKIIFKQQTQTPLSPENMSTYVQTKNALWYWTTIALTTMTTLTVFTIPENVYPTVYVRHVLASIFVLGLPGYALIKTLFPTKELDQIERIALSIGLSLAIVPMIGLLLNYTPWGIRLAPVTLILSALTITLATAAVIREFQAKCSQE